MWPLYEPRECHRRKSIRKSPLGIEFSTFFLRSFNYVFRKFQISNRICGRRYCATNKPRMSDAQSIRHSQRYPIPSNHTAVTPTAFGTNERTTRFSVGVVGKNTFSEFAGLRIWMFERDGRACNQIFTAKTRLIFRGFANSYYAHADSVECRTVCKRASTLGTGILIRREIGISGVYTREVL